MMLVQVFITVASVAVPAVVVGQEFGVGWGLATGFAIYALMPYRYGVR